MLAVQKCYIEDFTRIVSTMCTNFIMLEVWILNISFFFKLFNINVRLTNCWPPAVICQVSCPTESFNAALKNLKHDILCLQLLLKHSYEYFTIAIQDPVFPRSYVFALATTESVTPVQIIEIKIEI